MCVCRHVCVCACVCVCVCVFRGYACACLYVGYESDLSRASSIFKLLYSLFLAKMQSLTKDNSIFSSVSTVLWA